MLRGHDGLSLQSIIALLLIRMKSSWLHPVCFVVALAAAIAGALIARSSARGMDTLWDEQVDRAISTGLSEHPLTGGEESLDPSQLRLPMYVSALVEAWTGDHSLARLRGVSIFFGMVTVIATAGLGRSLFGPVAGMLAALLTAFSPYFLAYSRIAMTEGDIFVACFVTLSLWSYVSYLRQPTPARWMLASVLLGLALGTKLFAAFLILVFWVLANSTYSEPVFRLSRMANHARKLHSLLGWQLAIVLFCGVAAAGGRYIPDDSRFNWVAGPARMIAIIGWVALLVLWISTCVYVLASQIISRSRAARYWAMIGMAIITLFALTPVHMLDPSIAKEILFRTATWDHEYPLAHWGDHLRLYSGILLFKMTLPLGIITLCSLLYALFAERSEGRWRPCIIAILVYVAAVTILPLRQSFYLMAVYPLVMILLAAGLCGITKKASEMKSALVMTGWLLSLVAGLTYLGFEVRASYPNFHQFGADLLGSRLDWKWLEAECRGYRNLVQTPSDGVESVIRWCLEPGHIPAGSRVVSYFWEDAIVRDVLPEEPPFVFVPRGVTAASAEVPSKPVIFNADFVLLHINNLLGYGDRPPDTPSLDELKAGFSPVFTVKRGPMEVAWVYARRPAEGAPRPE